MAVGDLFDLQVQYSVDARKVTNNWGYRQTGGPDIANTPEVIVDAWQATHLVDFQKLLSDDVRLQCLYCTGVDKGLHLPFELPFTDLIGTDSSNAAPANTAWVMSLITNSNSSADNGRNYYCGLSDDSILNGELNPAFQAGGAAAWALRILQDLVSQADPSMTFELVVLDRIFNGIPLIPVLANKVVQAIVRPEIYSQRRRQTRRTSTAPPESVP